MAHSSVETLRSFMGAEPVAHHIGSRWHELKVARNKWEELKQELRNYIFATDTTTTANGRS